MSDLTNSLDLDPQDGDLELLGELKDVFEISFEPEDTHEIYTVGDLHDLLARKMPLLDGKKCRTQMTFYRLRKALTVMSPQTELRPVTNLSDIVLGAPRKFFRVLERSSGLKLPSLPLTRAGSVVWLALLFAFFPLIVFSLSGGGLAAFAAAGLAFGGMILIATHDRGLISGHLVTLGDLATATSAKNYSLLTKLGGRQSSEELWSALIELLAELSGALRKDEIRPSTTLFAGNRGR